MSSENLLIQEQALQKIIDKDVPLSDELMTELHEIIASVEIDFSFLDESKTTEPDNTEGSVPLPEPPAEDGIVNNAEHEEHQDIRHVLLNAKLPMKLKLALLGNATCRGLLIKDSNKMIQQCVLRNPKLQASEVEEFAKNPNLSNVVLRDISSNSQWMKIYSLKLNSQMV